MSKLLVKVDKRENIDEVLKLDIGGIILSYDDLAVASNFYVNMDDIKEIRKKTDKIIVVSLNKMMHNKDLAKLEEVIIELDRIKVDMILFYDVAIMEIKKRLGLDIPLIISQEHLNTSINSNEFYFEQGVEGSLISSDITKEELLEIRKKADKIIMFTGYGYLPIFYSRRYLITNYFAYIKKEKQGDCYFIRNNDDFYPIVQDEYGTIIYTKEPVNLVNELDDLDDIDYIVIDGFKASDLVDVIKDFIKKKKMNGLYQGFFHTKSIYKVKKQEVNSDEEN